LRYSLSVKKWLYATALLFAAPLIAFDPSTPLRLQGVACRVNRQIDRFLVAGDTGRIAVELGDEGKVTFDGEDIDESDMRPGDRVRITGNTTSDGVVVADSIDVDRFTGRTLLDALFPSSSIIGRFSVREAKTEFFSVNLPRRDYLRVDGRSAYGPKGRVLRRQFEEWRSAGAARQTEKQCPRSELHQRDHGRGADQLPRRRATRREQRSDCHT
jgi:hypothetical protein